MEVVWLFMLLPWMVNSLGTAVSRDVGLHITRQNIGDLFNPEGVTRGCKPDTCVGLSSGTAQAAPGSDLCHCQCHPHLPAFREDLRICVDDIHECVLSPFVGGSTSQQIPFVFLPLKGQIIHPSKEISFAGIHTPVCAVSGAKFLTEAGWVDLRNPLDTDVPFRLFRDEGRTFLQWVGEPDLRTKMSGRLVLVYLMCRELSELTISEGNALFSPCVAFRVVGSPTKYLNNVSEVAFSPDAHASADGSDHLSVSEYVAIGICSVLLGLIYVASVFLYLHLRKRSRGASQAKSDDQNPGSGEEGVVKNNPLLGMGAHFQPNDAVYSDSTNSDTDIAPDVIQHYDETRKKSSQVTSAMIHSQYKRNLNYASLTSVESILQDSSSNEKLPEENVSIVETLEGREERSDTLKAISGTVRRKLYFNPAYFEHQLLLAPPPAALEFLSKIREVITIAKQKMSTKKFAPSLIVIPEEESNYAVDPTYDYSRPSVSRRSSVISLKRENSRRKTCSGCPGCEPQDFRQLCGKLPEFPTLAACQTCAATATENKQRSIRKWLEDVPILKQVGTSAIEDEKPSRSFKRVRSPAKSLPPDEISTPSRALSPRPASERGKSPERVPNLPIRKKTVPNKPKAPSPPIKKSEKKVEVDINHHPPKVIMNFPPPDMIHEAMAVDSKTEEIKIPTLTKKQMKAVISELTEQRGVITDSDSPKSGPRKLLPIDYETDSLERTGTNAGYNTPSEYAEMSSSQPSPSLSTALPMDEEMTMRNAIFNKNTGNMTISKINVDILQEDDHDYELIVLKKGSLKKQSFYKLPELLQRNNGYSLVSEVYVNNGYNYNSAPSSQSGSNCSTLDKRTLKVRYDEGFEKPGKLLIEVEDCADNYIPVNDSDGFEPDTLDRKPSKMKFDQRPVIHQADDFVDSLERPHQISLRSSGSFKKDVPKPAVNPNNAGNFNRVFGSLREIYEAKTKSMKHMSLTDISDFDSDEGRLLTLEERHSKRQRRLTIGGNMIVPPDVIPPPPHDHPIYERPKPPRKIILADTNILLKPPLPPKNGNGRSASNLNIVDNIDVGTPVVDHGIFPKLPEDSGYLSTDSNKEKCSESEESLEDDRHSESGAESVETHSVFFGSFRKPVPYLDYGSNDSGVDTVKMIPNHKQHFKASVLVNRFKM